MDKKETNLPPVNMFFTRRFTEELKHKICKEHIDEGMCLSELVIKYQLSSHSLIHQWLRKYGYIKPSNTSVKKSVYIVGLNNYNQMAVDNTEKLSQTSSSLNEAPEDQSEIARLKKELLEAKIKAEGLERMIEIAEEQFKIPIRKK